MFLPSNWNWRTAMRRGISINIGLNSVDPYQYNNWDGALNAPESDANYMANLARARGFEVSPPLLTAAATYDAVVRAIKEAAQTLISDDILLLSYSGHGAPVPDTNGDEPDSVDEAFVLYDRELIDDELYGLWLRFQPGVRILVIADSCSSGSVVQFVRNHALWSTLSSLSGVKERVTGFRAIPQDVQEKHYERNKGLYEAAQANNLPWKKAPVQASVIQISSCQDNQLSADGHGTAYSVFTERLRTVWANGSFNGNYPQFFQQITSGMPELQTPNYFKAGVQNDKFEGQQPFTV
jgi:hypothetical protein